MLVNVQCNCCDSSAAELSSDSAREEPQGQLLGCEALSLSNSRVLLSQDACM